MSNTVMFAEKAQLIGSLILMAALAAGPGLALAQQLDESRRRAEDAADAADRARDEVEELRANEPPVHDRGALQQYRDELDRAERREERAEFRAESEAREAERTEQRRENVLRERRRQERLDQRRERRERAIDQNTPTPILR